MARMKDSSNLQVGRMATILEALRRDVRAGAASGVEECNKCARHLCGPRHENDVVRLAVVHQIEGLELVGSAVRFPAMVAHEQRAPPAAAVGVVAQPPY